MTIMTREDVHNRVKDMLAILSPSTVIIPDKDGEDYHFADDVDLLRACVKHEMLDKEASVREAFASGYEKGLKEG